MPEHPAGPTLARSGAGAGGEAVEREARARRWGKHVVRIALVVAITWALYRAIGIDFADLDRAALARWQPHPVPLIGSAALLIAVYLTHALLWRRIAGDIIGERLPVGAALRIYFLANLGRYLPGRIWQVAGMAVLAKRAGIPALGAIAASALAQLCFLLTGAIFMAALLPFAVGTGPALVAIGGCAILIGTLWWLIGTNEGTALRERLGTRFGPRVASALDAIGRVRPRHALVWLGGYILSWVMLGGAFAIFTTAFVPAAVTELRFVAGTMAASYLSGYLAIFAPAGVGVREGIMALLLDRVVPAPAALLVSVASRIWFTITELIVLLVIPFLPRVEARNTGTEPVEEAT